MTDNPITALLQQHLNGVDISGQLTEMMQADPQLAPMAQLLADRQTQLQAQIDSQHEDEVLLNDEITLRERDELIEQQNRDIEQLDSQAQVLHRRLERATGEIQRLRSMLDLVAAALGACPSCLGENPECLLCRGRGVPGSLPPDPESFTAVVWPAVRAAHSYQCSRTVRGRGKSDAQERIA